MALVGGAVAGALAFGELEQVADVVEQRGGHERRPTAPAARASAAVCSAWATWKISSS